MTPVHFLVDRISLMSLVPPSSNVQPKPETHRPASGFLTMSIIESEVLIVGAGVFGVSTAYYLAKQSSNPSSITILDRDRPPSTPAASTDYNKIIRADYSDPLYMDLAFEAIDAWKKNPLFTTAGVYHETGWISMGERGSDLTSQIRDNFQMSGRPDPTKDMTENEVRSSWGGILEDADLRPFDSYYYNPSAGWAEAGAALKIMADEAIRMGVQYKVDEANRLMLDQHGVRGVQTNNGKIYTAKKIILATGAWTSEMMTLTEDQLRMPMESRIESQLTAAGVCVVHYKLTDAERGSYDQLPVCVYGEQGKLTWRAPSKSLNNLFRRNIAPNGIRTYKIYQYGLIQEHRSYR
jgi:sarcosine oxidase/L-pipecolate oxidase